MRSDKLANRPHRERKNDGERMVVRRRSALGGCKPLARPC
jgi:hypothetical protein